MSSMIRGPETLLERFQLEKVETVDLTAHIGVLDPKMRGEVVIPPRGCPASRDDFQRSDSALDSHGR